MNKTKLIVAILCLLLGACSGGAGKNGNKETPANPPPASTGGSIPLPITNTGNNDFQALKLKLGTPKRREYFEILSKVYGKSQSYALTTQKQIAYIPCFFLAAVNAEEKDAALAIDEMQACLRSAVGIAQFLGSDAKYFKASEALKFLQAPIQRRRGLERNYEFARISTTLLGVLESLKNYPLVDRRSEQKQISEYTRAELENIAPLVMTYLFLKAHASPTGAEFKNLYLDTILKNMQNNGAAPSDIASPYEKPDLWLASLSQSLHLHLPAKVNSIYELMLSPDASDALLKKYFLPPFADVAGAFPEISLRFSEIQKDLEKAYSEFVLREKSGVANDIHEHLKQKIHDLESAANALIDIIALFDNNAAQETRALLASLIRAHNILADFLSGGSSPMQFLADIAKSGVEILASLGGSNSLSEGDKSILHDSLSGIQTLLLSMKNDMGDRFNRVDEEFKELVSVLTKNQDELLQHFAQTEAILNNINSRLAFTQEIALQGFQSTLVAPYEEAANKCLGPESLIFDPNTHASPEFIRDCMSSFSSRALRLAFNPLISGSAYSDTTNSLNPAQISGEFSFGWLATRLSGDFSGNIPNPRQWSSGAGDYLLMSFLSDDFSHTTTTMDGLLASGARLEKFAEAVQNKSAFIDNLNEYQKNYSNLRELLKTSLQEFSNTQLGGLDLAKYPATLMANGKAITPIDIAQALHLVRTETEGKVEFMDASCASPFVENPYSTMNICLELKYKLRVYAKDEGDEEKIIGYVPLSRLTKIYTLYDQSFNCPQNSACAFAQIQAQINAASSDIQSKVPQLVPLDFHTDPLDAELRKRIDARLTEIDEELAKRLHVLLEDKAVAKILSQLEESCSVLRAIADIVYSRDLQKDTPIATMFSGSLKLPCASDIRSAANSGRALAVLLETDPKATMEAAIKFLPENTMPLPAYITKTLNQVRAVAELDELSK